MIIDCRVTGPTVMMWTSASNQVVGTATIVLLNMPGSLIVIIAVIFIFIAIIIIIIIIIFLNAPGVCGINTRGHHVPCWIISIIRINVISFLNLQSFLLTPKSRIPELLSDSCLIRILES